MSRGVRTALLLGALVLIPVSLYLGVYLRYRLVPAQGLPDDVAASAMAALRGALEAQGTPAKEYPLPEDRPLWVTLRLDGKLLFRARLDRGSVPERLDQAAALIKADDQL